MPCCPARASFLTPATTPIIVLSSSHMLFFHSLKPGSLRLCVPLVAKLSSLAGAGSGGRARAAIFESTGYHRHGKHPLPGGRLTTSTRVSVAELVRHRLHSTMPAKAYAQPIVNSTAVFRDGLFDGKVLFCTGGGSGICKEMTRSIMRHGANAAIVGRKFDRLSESAEELSKDTGRNCLPVQADVRQPKALQDAVAKTIEKFGRIDFVICGAAGNFLAPISGLSENAFRTVIEIDTLGTYHTIKATLPHVRKAKGSYIHVSATLHYRGTPYQAHVSAAKAAVDATSNVLAVEEGPLGVRSNVIAPGPIGGTEGMDRLGTKGPDGEQALRVPAGRLGDKQDIANTAVFLFSDAASFITGQVIAVDGGDQHLRSTQLPYPESVLDPKSVSDLIKPRL
ncbi:NAD(P)-binding protein [Trametopsis cervina]|nr:NAD(P)-binding protein [Trametopsis cervina]